MQHVHCIQYESLESITPTKRRLHCWTCLETHPSTHSKKRAAESRGFTWPTPTFARLHPRPISLRRSAITISRRPRSKSKKSFQQSHHHQHLYLHKCHPNVAAQSRAPMLLPQFSSGLAVHLKPQHHHSPSIVTTSPNSPTSS